MDWKGIGLSVGIAISFACPLAGAQPSADVELVCDGEYGFPHAGEWNKVDSLGVYVRIFNQSVRIAGGVGPLNDTYARVKTDNEAGVSFSNAGIDGHLNRHSGRLAVSSPFAEGKKVEFIFEALCSRPKPLF